MSTQVFADSARDGRSVLGMVSVQVERDPRTGATVVRSVAPVSSSSCADRANVVFDDGRKSIHTMGGSEGQPSTQELGQILNVIDGVGMTALLDDVTMVTTKEEKKSENADVSRRPQEKLHQMKEDHVTRGDGATVYVSQPEFSREENKVNEGDGNIVEEAADDIEEQKFEDGPVTLLFLGYTDATTQNIREGDDGMLTVERVMITDDGEEYVIGSETSTASTPTLDKETDGREETKETREEGVPQILSDENGPDCKVEGEEKVEPPLQVSTSPTSDKTGGGAKKRTCQCCSVM